MRMNEIEFSVVVPVFNKEYSVERCISSIVDQELPAKDVVIVDDGSTDGSLKTIKSIIRSKGLANFRVISQKNSGVSSARNKGLACCKSKYVCLLDADDYWDPMFLSTIYGLIKENPEAVMFSTGHKVKKGESLPVEAISGVKSGYRGRIDDFFEASSRGSIVNSSKLCVKKYAIDSIGGFPEGISCGEDLFTWIRLSGKGAVVYTDEPLAFVCQVEDESRGMRRGVVPYPIVYYSAKENKKKISPGLRKYLVRIGFRHILGSLSNAQYREAGLRALYFSKISPSYAFLSVFFFLVPPFLFRKARK